MRPGFGARHPALHALLGRQSPVLRIDTAWLDGELLLRVSAYTTTPDLPAELVTSVRCLVTVGSRVVVCRNERETHPWPGGRLEPGESAIDAAIREVHEETGWHLDPASIRQLGWLRFEHLEPKGADHAFPHPDFLQLVLTAVADERDEAASGEWRDTEGYEEQSWLASVDEAKTTPGMHRLALPYLNLVGR